MLDIRFADAPLGHEIRGIDLSQPISDETFAEIEQAYDAYGVVFFRNQALTPDQQIAFSRRFGALDRYIVDTFLLPGHPEIFVVSNVVENGRPIGMADAGRTWHSDMPIVAEPPRGSMLYALEVPETADGPLGDTLFASTQAAYDALPADVQRRIDGVQAVFSYAQYIDRRKGDRPSAQETVTGQGEHERQRATYPDILHPLVRRHPRTGRKCIYLTENTMKGIVGMPDGEAVALFDELLAHMTRPEFVYRHKWRVGDLVMWDNCSAVHCAVPDYPPDLRRRMHRTTLKGSKPF